MNESGVAACSSGPEIRPAPAVLGTRRNAAAPLPNMWRVKSFVCLYRDPTMTGPLAPHRPTVASAVTALPLAATLCLHALPANAADVTVKDVASLRAAAGAAKPGTRILLAPGEYPGGTLLSGVAGSAAMPVVIAAADPAKPPVFRGGAEGLHLSDVAYLELRDLAFIGARGNGLNMDDGGTFSTPSHHVLLRNLRVSDVGPGGNRDGIKLSGLDDFRVENCTIERWGDGGQGIDMVGCHRGVIEGCTFRQGGGKTGVGVQTKGGSEAITIRKNRFEEAGDRAVNLGGSTGLQFFRPKVQGYEAKDIRVEGNTFVGSQAPVAFVGVDGAAVRFNTLYHPEKWALRILQETRAPGFVPSRNGVFENNIVVFQSGRWTEGGCNIGPNTAPQTFRFAGNLWYCEDRPDRSRPTLPTPETVGVYGKDPLFRDPAKGDFTLRPGSPAARKGVPGLR